VDTDKVDTVYSFEMDVDICEISKGFSEGVDEEVVRKLEEEVEKRWVVDKDVSDRILEFVRYSRRE